MTLAANRRQILAGLGATSVAGCGSNHSAARGLRLRAATDVSSKHILSVTLRRFMDAIAAEFPDKLHYELFDAGKLFFDRDMPRAVFRGDLDLAAPALTGVARIVPGCGLTSLPLFYGIAEEVTHRIIDGPIGERLAQDIERKIGGKVLRPFTDLGYVDLFCTSVEKAESGAAGQKVRVPSGATSVLRLKTLGARPVMMPFADVPLALSQGVVDAIESTAETVRTTQLWDAGIVACLRTRALFQQYVPMLSHRFWVSADQNLRDACIHHWQETANWARKESFERQAKARTICTENGIRMIEPSAELLARERQTLLPQTDAIAAAVGIGPDLLAAARKELAQ